MNTSSRAASFFAGLSLMARLPIGLCATLISWRIALSSVLLIFALLASTWRVESQPGGETARGRALTLRTVAQQNMAASCCGKKPAFSHSAYSGVFTGQLAVTTQLPVPPNYFALEIIDL